MLILSFLEHNSHGHHPLSLHGKKNSFNIIQNIFFCVQQKKVSQTGSEWHKNEQMMTTVISGELFHFLNQEILQRMGFELYIIAF